jgi:hypothetical protein
MCICCSLSRCGAYLQSSVLGGHAQVQHSQVPSSQPQPTCSPLFLLLAERRCWSELTYRRTKKACVVLGVRSPWRRAASFILYYPCVRYNSHRCLLRLPACAPQTHEEEGRRGASIRSGHPSTRPACSSRAPAKATNRPIVPVLFRQAAAPAPAPPPHSPSRGAFSDPPPGWHRHPGPKCEEPCSASEHGRNRAACIPSPRAAATTTGPPRRWAPRGPATSGSGACTPPPPPRIRRRRAGRSTSRTRLAPPAGGCGPASPSPSWSRWSVPRWRPPWCSGPGSTSWCGTRSAPASRCEWPGSPPLSCFPPACGGDGGLTASLLRGGCQI